MKPGAICDRQENGFTKKSPKLCISLAKNEVDFWVEVNFCKNENFFVAYNKIQTLTLLEKLLIDADSEEKF